MKIVLWDTRRNDVQKDFAGGMGVGMHPGHGGWRGRMVRRWYLRDYRPVAMNFAYLAAVFKTLGHAVEYSEDNFPSGDVYVFNPALMTLAAECRAMMEVRRRLPHAKILVTGQVAYALGAAFHDAGATVVRGEPEQLLWKLEEVIQAEAVEVSVGSVRRLDDLPYPDWLSFPIADSVSNMIFGDFRLG